MTRCLSERALLRLVAGDGRAAQHAHRAACARCEAHYRAIMSDLDRVSDVLLHTEPIPSTRSLLARYWMPLTASAVAALALLVWVEIAVWRAVTPAQQEEVAAFLSDVSATMFSTRDALAAQDEATLDPLSDADIFAPDADANDDNEQRR